MRVVKIYRDDYPSYYKYRLAINEYRRSGYIIRNVCGGVFCFASASDYELWRNQR